jgi:hypothetical protein
VTHYPISTAPKDRRILLGYKHLPAWVCGEWDDEWQSWSNDLLDYGPESWREDYGEPSHWAELPPDPE